MINNLSINHVKSGVVFIDSEPYYYVDMLDGDSGKMVVAYEIDDDSYKSYKKMEEPDPNILGKSKQVKTGFIHHFLTDKHGEALTKLSKKALNSNKDAAEKVSKTVYKAALFISPVIMRNDTFDKIYTECFAEMVPTKLQGPQTGTYVNMEPTGVNIGLHHIYWISDSYSLGEWEGYSSLLYDSYTTIFSQPDNTGIGMINIDH